MKADDFWRGKERAERFLKDINGSIPLEAVHLDVMMRLIRHKDGSVNNLFDIGCGNGILTSVILNEFPQAHAALLDFSDTMIDAAKEKLNSYGDQIKFIKSDYGKEALAAQMSEDNKSFDVIVSRFSIHHQPDERKLQVYKEIYEMLNPDGIFINIEYNASISIWSNNVFEDYVCDHLYDFSRKKGEFKNREEIVRNFRTRHDNDAEVVTSVGKQCRWLSEIGFSDVDCYFRIFNIALFAGRKT